MKKIINGLMFSSLFISGFTFAPRSEINQNKIINTGLTKLLTSPSVLSAKSIKLSAEDTSETDDKFLKTRTIEKTNNQEDAHITLNMNNKHEFILTINSDKILEDIYKAGKPSGAGALSIYEKNKNNLVLSSNAILFTSYVYLKKEGVKNKPKIPLHDACKSVFIYEDKSCKISPLGNIEHINFVFDFIPWSFLIYKKDQVIINKDFNIVSSNNPATDTFSVDNIFKKSRFDKHAKAMNREIYNWFSTKFIFKSNFADVVWANKYTSRKDLQQGFNIKSDVKFNSIEPSPISPFFFWTPLIFLIIAPFGYYTFKKFKNKGE